jgi:hypothetical protein
MSRVNRKTKPVNPTVEYHSPRENEYCPGIIIQDGRLDRFGSLSGGKLLELFKLMERASGIPVDELRIRFAEMARARVQGRWPDSLVKHLLKRAAS